MEIKKINFNEIQSLDNIIKRDTASFYQQEKIVSEIIDNIINNKDKALFSYTKEFDGITLTKDSIFVSDEEINEALDTVDKDLFETIKKSAENIRNYHEKIVTEGFSYNPSEGISLGQKVTPLNRVGIYVPGGKASYPSTVLMDAIPASVAGVNEIIMTSPAGHDGKLNPVIIAAAVCAGVNKILKIGGAQAIAALAYGTESVPKVDKIVGPGNIYVALAKKQVFGKVALDSVAGPSEITVICDDNSNPKFAAADLLSQAEHDEIAQSILLCTSLEFAKKCEDEINAYIKTSKRGDIIKKSLSDYGLFIICKDIHECISCANKIAPEHLELLIDNARDYLDEVVNAGAIFLGEYSCEPLGDYFAGPNHVLPTNGTARFFSPLGTYDFVKRSSVIEYSKDEFIKASEHVIRFAESEGLMAHANSVSVRKE